MSERERKSAFKNLAGLLRVDEAQKQAGNKLVVQRAQGEQAEQISDAVPRGPFNVNVERSYQGEEYTDAIKKTYRKDQ